MEPRLVPGVYVEEIPSAPPAISGVETSVAGFVGECRAGPVNTAVELHAPDDVGARLGGTGPLGSGASRRPNLLARSVLAFFENGGTHAFVVRIKGDRLGGSVASHERGLAALEPAPVSIVCCPGAPAHPSRALGVAAALAAHAEKMRDRFAIIDPPRGASLTEARAFRAAFETSWAALYYPWIKSTVGGGVRPTLLPPSGFIAGVYARGDMHRGVHKAPANIVINAWRDFEQRITTADAEVLNPESINALRLMPGRSPRVMGARTLSRDLELRYVNVRRLLIFLESSIQRGTGWAIFEPNDARTWARMRAAIENFLDGQWRAGALEGDQSKEAYFVRCDRTTMTQDDLDRGRLVCLVGVAPVKPAEFVIFRVGQWTADRDA